MSKKFLKFQPQGWINQGRGKFGWSENFNEHPNIWWRVFKTTRSNIGKILGFSKCINIFKMHKITQDLSI